jgi:hypothetical protein
MNCLIENSNKNIMSYVILQKTKCMRQISDKVFEATNDFVFEYEVYDAELLCKMDNKYYLFLGYDDLLEYEVYIPILFTDNVNLNIMKLNY